MVTVDVDDSGEYKDGREVQDDILYTVEETPPWYLCIILGFQV